MTAKLNALVAEASSTLDELCGLSTRSAAELLVEVADPCRFNDGGFACVNGTAPLPASSGEGPGEPVRHRLNRGGNRRVNAVIHRMAVTQRRCDPRAQLFDDARRGHTKKEAMRILKRHLSKAAPEVGLVGGAPRAIEHRRVSARTRRRIARRGQGRLLLSRPNEAGPPPRRYRCLMAQDVPTGLTATGFRLVVLITGLSLAHHIDHVMRSVTGWPWSGGFNPFSASLLVYPTILGGLLASRRQLVGAGFWSVLAGGGALFIGFVHVGPVAGDSVATISDQYGSPYADVAALIVLAALLVTLALHLAHELGRMRRFARASPGRGDRDLRRPS